MKTQTDLSLEQLVVQFDYNELNQETLSVYADYFTTEEEYLSLKELFSGLQQLAHEGPDETVKHRLDNLFAETHQKHVGKIRGLSFHWKQLAAAVFVLAVGTVVFWQSKSDSSLNNKVQSTKQAVKDQPVNKLVQTADQETQKTPITDAVNPTIPVRKPEPDAIQLAANDPVPVAVPIPLEQAPAFSFMRSAEPLTDQSGNKLTSDQQVLPQDGIYSAKETINFSQKANDSLLLLIVPND